MIIRPPPLRITRRTLIKAAAVSLVAPAILTLGSREARAAYGFVASTHAKGDGTVSSPGIDTSPANLLVAVLCGFGSTTQTLSDSKFNIWVQIGTSVTFSGNVLSFWYVASPTVGSGHTFTVTNLGQFASLCVAAFSGANSTPLDQHSQAAAAQAGSITPSVANCLVVAGCAAVDAQSVSSINSSYTLQENNAYTGGTSESSALAYIIQTSAIATNPTWTVTSSTPAAVLASFKPSAGAAACVPTRALMGVGC